MRSIWIVTAIVAPVCHVLAASTVNMNLAVRGEGDGPEDCDPEFFEMSEKNLKESGSDEYYRDFIAKTSLAKPDEYSRLGEVSFFAQEAFNGFEVRCSSQTKGCTGIPTCRDVLGHVQRHGGDRDKARKIYFSIKKIESIVDAIFWFHRVSAVIEHHATLVSELILKDFAPKRKWVAEDKCRIIKAGHKAVSIITKSLETMVSSPTGGFAVGSIFSLATKLVEQYGEHGSAHVEMALLEKAVNGNIEIYGLKHENAKTYADEMCDMELGPESSKKTSSSTSSSGDKKGDPEDKDFARQGQILRKQITKVSSSIRETISKILDTVVTGNALTFPEFNYFYELMSRHDWTEEARRFYESFDDKRATQIFEESLINISWEDGKCYGKCSCSDQGSPLGPATTFCEEPDNKKDNNWKYRYCPADRNGCACQLQCFASNWDHRKNEVQLLGMDRLASWDIDFKEILMNSYAKYRSTKHDLPEIGKGIVEPFKPVKSGNELLELPVCVTSQLELTDFPKHGSHNRLFPCTCGDWRSNETQIFMEELGFGKSQPGYKSKAAKDLFTLSCPKILGEAKLKPFNHFLALCELGIKWPHRGDRKKSHGSIPLLEAHHAQINQVDSRCSRLRQETEGMDEDAANFHFCTMSDTAKEVFEDEHYHISGAGLLHPGTKFHSGLRNQWADSGNHRHMCKHWIRYR